MQKLVFVYIQLYQTNVNISARKLVVSSRSKKKEKKKQVYMKMNVVLKIDYRVNRGYKVRIERQETNIQSAAIGTRVVFCPEKFVMRADMSKKTTS